MSASHISPVVSQDATPDRRSSPGRAPGTGSRRPPIHGSAPRAAFGKLVACEARLALRQPVGVIFGLGMPVLLLAIFGSVPKFRETSKALGGITLFQAYIPILIALVIAALALWGLSGSLATYREQGILRRLSTTPVPPSWLLAAQMVVNLCLAVVAIAIVLVGGIVGFGAAAPEDAAGFVLAALLTIIALFALGLLIAAVAPSAAAAGAIGSVTFFPLMFFAGLWVPLQLMPDVLQKIGHFTPLGAAVQALQTAMGGAFPPAQALLVLAAYGVVFALLAVRYFRWE